MHESPSRYGGIAAVLVFGIGLLAVGRIWSGIVALGCGALALAIALSPTVAGRLFFFALGLLICSAVLCVKAASNEINGTAIYHFAAGRHSRSESVTRQDSPAKFRQATNFLWAGSLLCLVGGAVAFNFARKLDDCVDDF